MEIRIQYIFLVLGINFLSQHLFSKEKVPKKDPTFTSYEESQHKDNNASELVEPSIKRKQVNVANIDAEDIEIGLFMAQ